MTSSECVLFIREILDTDHNDFYTDVNIIDAVNEAMNVYINVLHTNEDERGLRLLYDTSHYKNSITTYVPIVNNGSINDKCLYPKGLVINAGDENLFSQYIPYSKFTVMPIVNNPYIQTIS